MELTKNWLEQNKVVFFDGECNFCDKSVQFIRKRDSKNQFYFASLQSDVKDEAFKVLNLAFRADIDSIVLLKNGNVHYKSSAALLISKGLKGIWPLFYYFFFWLPNFFRDFFYDILAKNRYRWFGKKEECAIPTKQDRKQMLV